MSEINSFPAPRDRKKVKSYASRASLTIEESPLTKSNQIVGVTLNIQLAPKVNQSYDWDRSVLIQLSEDELPVFGAVCLGYLPRCKFSRPGKGISVERQANKLYFEGTQGPGNICQVPTNIGDSFMINAMVLSQLQKQAGIEDGSLLVSAIRGAASLYKSQV